MPDLPTRPEPSIPFRWRVTRPDPDMQATVEQMRSRTPLLALLAAGATEPPKPRHLRAVPDELASPAGPTLTRSRWNCHDAGHRGSARLTVALPAASLRADRSPRPVSTRLSAAIPERHHQRHT